MESNASDWLNSKLYKMHVRVFLSKFRSYTECPDCRGTRLKPESLDWKWHGHTLPQLYQQSVDDLHELLATAASRTPASNAHAEHDPALEGILNRLSFLKAVGLGYLTLDRSSRTLSGGETMRVNLTSCLGSALVDTLFVLDEPSVGLHPQDMDRLVSILRRLTDLGNTVVVVEHDEAVMRAADHIVEIGPDPGINGGQLVFNGSYQSILSRHYRALRPGGTPSPLRRNAAPRRNATPHPPPSLAPHPRRQQHNLRALDVSIPQQSLVCLSGASGSGKSTLLNNVIYQNLLVQKGLAVDEPAQRDIDSTLPLAEVLLIDQAGLQDTALQPGQLHRCQNEIRSAFAQQESVSIGMGPGHFSFNSGDGRRPTARRATNASKRCLLDLYVPCESCEGQRFKDEVLAIRSMDAVSRTSCKWILNRR